MRLIIAAFALSLVASITKTATCFSVLPSTLGRSAATQSTLALGFTPGQRRMESVVSTDNPCPLLPPPINPEATAEFAMGWFWGPQRDFDRTEGIVDTVVGYSGSSDPQTLTNPTYKKIHDYAESIRVHFDPSKLEYKDLLKMFFSFHTPTNPKWSGTQYRSAIFVNSEEQRKLAEEAVKEWGAMGKFVSVEDTSDFYKAEEYHQRYLDKY